jgi:hypothetical protein
LNGQTSGRLIYVGTFCINNLANQELIQYDTSYSSSHGVDYYPLDDGNYIQLVFIGNKGIPFGTFRKRYKEGRDRLSEYKTNINKIYQIDILNKEEYV